MCFVSNSNMVASPKSPGGHSNGLRSGFGYSLISVLIIVRLAHKPVDDSHGVVRARSGFGPQLEQHRMVYADFLGEFTPRKIVLLTVGF